MTGAGCEALSFFLQRATLERSPEGWAGIKIQEISGAEPALVFLAHISDNDLEGIIIRSFSITCFCSQVS